MNAETKNSELDTGALVMRTPRSRLGAAINLVMAALSRDGISKSRKNQQQGFMYRGIEDVYAVLSGLMVEHGLIVSISYSDRQVTQHTSKSGGTLFNVVLRGTFTLAHIDEPQVGLVSTFYGEGMDSADKATNKAMSVCHKYWALQTFVIPTEGVQDDPDAETHQVEKPAAVRVPARDSAAARAQLSLKMARDFIAANDPAGYVQHMAQLPGAKRAQDWIEKQLTEDEQEWVAKVTFDGGEIEHQDQDRPDDQ